MALGRVTRFDAEPDSWECPECGDDFDGRRCRSCGYEPEDSREPREPDEFDNTGYGWDGGR